MSDKPVSAVPGIGAKSEKILNAQGVTTIGQLAACDYRVIQSVPKILTFIAAAKQFLKEDKQETQVVELVSNGKSVDAKETTSENDSTALLLQSHSWFCKRAFIPCNEDSRELVIWELCVEPNNRVSMICTWIDNEDLCKMTYSPQFLIHYNPELPMLEVSIKPETLKGLLQREALSNTLMELDTMTRFC